MDKQQVLELARQSGMLVGDDRARSRGLEGATVEDLLAFAELVAKAEREECAALCENQLDYHMPPARSPQHASAAVEALGLFADAIRSRA